MNNLKDMLVVDGEITVVNAATTEVNGNTYSLEKLVELTKEDIYFASIEAFGESFPLITKGIVEGKDDCIFSNPRAVMQRVRKSEVDLKSFYESCLRNFCKVAERDFNHKLANLVGESTSKIIPMETFKGIVESNLNHIKNDYYEIMAEAVEEAARKRNIAP